MDLIQNLRNKKEINGFVVYGWAIAEMLNDKDFTILTETDKKILMGIIKKLNKI